MWTSASSMTHPENDRPQRHFLLNCLVMPPAHSTPHTQFFLVLFTPPFKRETLSARPLRTLKILSLEHILPNLSHLVATDFQIVSPYLSPSLLLFFHLALAKYGNNICPIENRVEIYLMYKLFI